MRKTLFIVLLVPIFFYNNCDSGFNRTSALSNDTLNDNSDGRNPEQPEPPESAEHMNMLETPVPEDQENDTSEPPTPEDQENEMPGNQNDMQSNANSTAIDHNSASKPIGWASVSACGPQGTIGAGEAAQEVVVTNHDELMSALTSSGPKVIKLNGHITYEDVQRFNYVKDKTLIGLSGARIEGGVRFKGAHNLIVKNIEFANAKVNIDAFELTASRCVWFDHNTFRDGGDGNLDIVRGSNYITVSWNKFYYTRGHDHMLSNLNGGSNENSDDPGKLDVTFHHNWWGAGVHSRMPRVRFGRTHIFNNYYKYVKVSGDMGHGTVIGAGYQSNLLIENNYFEESKNPIYFVSENGTAVVEHRGNIFDNTSGYKVNRGEAFIPPYEYDLNPAQNIPALVQSGAGAK